jgi:hypothetical protein
MKTTSSDVYIKILKYANDNPGFTLQQIIDILPDQKGIIYREITNRKQIFVQSTEDAKDNYMLTFEGRMLLLQYEELEQARKSSRNAMFIAILAIVISFASIILSA